MKDIVKLLRSGVMDTGVLISSAAEINAIMEMGAYEIESLRAQLAAANAEVQEQARLNGMGSEREAKLLAQLEDGHRQLLATQANAARMENALEIIAGRRQCIDNLLSNVDIANAVLSTPHQPRRLA